MFSIPPGPMGSDTHRAIRRGPLPSPSPSHHHPPGPVCSTRLPTVVPITFAELWANYVTGDPYRDPKTGRIPPGYENQCALRMSATFRKAGVDMSSFHGRSRVLLDGKFAAAKASELADWLSHAQRTGLPSRSENITGKDWQAKIKGRTGIVYFENYWTRPGESPARASGSHIDLWNGSRLTISGFVDGFATLGRYAGIDSVRQGATVLPDWSYSDLGKATTILFWDVK